MLEVKVPGRTSLVRRRAADAALLIDAFRFKRTEKVAQILNWGKTRWLGRRPVGSALLSHTTFDQAGARRY